MPGPDPCAELGLMPPAPSPPPPTRSVAARHPRRRAATAPARRTNPETRARDGRPMIWGCMVKMQLPPSRRMPSSSSCQIVRTWAVVAIGRSQLAALNQKCGASSRSHCTGSSTAPRMNIGADVVHEVGRIAQTVGTQQLDRGRRELPRRRAVAGWAPLPGAPGCHARARAPAPPRRGTCPPVSGGCSRAGRSHGRHRRSAPPARGGARRPGQARRTWPGSHGFGAAPVSAAPRPWRRRCPGTALRVDRRWPDPRRSTPPRRRSRT